MGWTLNPDNPHMDPTSPGRQATENWAKVFEEWSLRYGTDVSGWWIDGCFPRTGFTNENEMPASREIVGHKDGLIV